MLQKDVWFKISNYIRHCAANTQFQNQSGIETEENKNTTKVKTNGFHHSLALFFFSHGILFLALFFFLMIFCFWLYFFPLMIFCFSVCDYLVSLFLPCPVFMVSSFFYLSPNPLRVFVCQIFGISFFLSLSSCVYASTFSPFSVF